MWHIRAMTLDEPGLAEAGFRLDPLDETHRAVLAASGATEAMWNWMPVMPAGTSFNSYFDFILTEGRAGRMVPFFITRESDGAFAGVITFMNIFRTHAACGSGTGGIRNTCAAGFRRPQPPSP